MLNDLDALDRLVRGDVGGSLSLASAPHPEAQEVREAPAANGQPVSESVSAAASVEGQHERASAGLAPTALTAAPAPAAIAVPVRLELMDELLRLSGEASVAVAAWHPVLATAGSATVSLRRLIDRLRTVTEEIASAAPGAADDPVAAVAGAPAPAAESPEAAAFDALELDRYTAADTVAREIAEIAAESLSAEREISSALETAAELVTAQRHNTTTLQDRLLASRLVPLEDLAGRLQRAVRGVALRRGKEVEFVFDGANVRVDRSLVDPVADALIHLVRNAVDHGIEPPDVRLARGKRPAGTVHIGARQDQGDVVIDVTDDGAGIDAERLLAAARARGEQVPVDDAYSLLFRPGFSTASQVDDVSGRGIGLDAVRDSLRRVRGGVEVASEPGHGTIFSLRFPIKLAQARVVLAEAAGSPVALPAGAVRRIARLRDVPTERFGGQTIARLDGQTYPIADLAATLALPPAPLPDNPPVLFVEVAGRRAALLAGSVVGQQDVVMKNTGSHLQGLRGVAGATLLQDGRVALLLHLPDVLGARVARQPQTEAPAAAARAATLGGAAGDGASPHLEAARALRVLVVDDSPTIRKLLVRMLKDLGWQPVEAKDGAEALEAIRTGRPDAVLADVEMPRMDGYGLLAALRAQPETADLPVVMLTSRTAERHRQRARELGANGYLTKPYRPADVVAALRGVVPGWDGSATGTAGAHVVA
jgi:chemosensory pili system protein ChpA (sensor histidine kinase/response regulator)